jgi:hypothetical protein
MEIVVRGPHELMDPPISLAQLIEGTVRRSEEGRFRWFAEEYERFRSEPPNRLMQVVHPGYPHNISLLDYLLGRILSTATREICDCIARGAFEGRGVLVHRDIIHPAGVIPPSAITETMMLGPKGELLQERVKSVDEIGTRVPAWKSVSVNRGGLFDFIKAEMSMVWSAETTVDDERKCREWFMDLMQASPGYRSETNKALIARASEKFDIPEAAIKRAKGEAVRATGATAWSAPGRPKKSAS